MNYISPRISIVDGTHLCLLPSSNDVLNGSGGGGSSEKNQHQQIHVANDMHRTNNKDQTINIPAVPLSSICNIYNGEYISCSSGDDTATGDINIDRGQLSKSSCDKNNLHELPIEAIQIQTSDITNAQYRFIHSTSLINNNGSTANNLPLRIVVSDDLEESEVSTNNKHVKVTLPSFTSFGEHISAQYKDEDECKIYGGEHYNITNDDTGIDDMTYSTQSGSGNKSQQSIEVQAAGSCLVADFLGIVGYEQALVLPQISADLLSKLGSTNMNDESIQQQKELLQMILRHSFLIDGMGILLPKSYANNTHLTTTKTDDNYSMLSLTMSSLGRFDQDAVDVEESPDNGGSELLTQEGEASAQHPSNTSKDIHPTDISNTEPQEDPEWLNLIAQTVKDRLSKQVEQSNQIKRSAQARIDLVNQGRRTLHAASRPMMNHSAKGEDGYYNDPEVFRLRYGMRPRTSSSSCSGGVSVVLDLELDILMPRIRGEDKPDSTNSTTLHDFHISCSLTSNKNNQTTTTPENIRTSSGVVPTLQSGDCITMLASVCLEDLKMSMNDDDNSTLDVSIQGLWVDAASSTTSNPTRRGAVLCILRLPIDSLFLAPPISSQQRSGGQWIQHEIDFTSNNQHHYPEPDVIIDYRQPRTLTIDTSNEMNSANAKMWKDLVTNLNASIGSSYIDLYCKKNSPRLELVIFSSNPEERVGEWCFVVCRKGRFLKACTYLSSTPNNSCRQARSTKFT